MKICCACKKNLPLEAFGVHSSKKDGLQHRCKVCRSSYMREWYSKDAEKNRGHIKRWNSKNKLLVREFVKNYLLAHPCVDCGEKDIIVLEFDHKSKDSKMFIIANGIQGGKSLAKIKEEIAKCEVRCANCHRRKTYKQLNHMNKN